MKKRSTLKGFEVLGEEIREKASKYLKEGKRVILFCARRGLHPLSVCGDCGSIVKCSRCSSPAVLHKTSGSRYFVCHKCGEKRQAEDRCRRCHSWKIDTMGIGTQLVEKEAKKIFKDIKISRFDSDTVKTPKQAETVLNGVREGGILVATEMALNYLDDAEMSAIVSFDSYFSLPDFRISEKVFKLVLRIREMTSGELLIQSRNPEEPSLLLSSAGRLGEFYKEEMAAREKFDLPPLRTLIRLTLSGSKERLLNEREKISSFLSPRKIVFYEAFTGVRRGRHVLNGLIMLRPQEWPDPDLRKKLQNLPQYISIDVDPESLL